jgi:hypothetical protein
LKSSSSWSFPPRPWTHHVRWIEPDKNKKQYLFVAIEAGALVQSHDGGESWIDRVDTGPYDTHTLLTHKLAPKRLYSAAGDGYFESNDYGQSWIRPDEGLYHRYLFGMAVDSTNPQNIKPFLYNFIFINVLHSLGLLFWSKKKIMKMRK